MASRLDKGQHHICKAFISLDNNAHRQLFSRNRGICDRKVNQKL